MEREESSEMDIQELMPEDLSLFQIIKGYLKFLFKICKP